MNEQMKPTLDHPAHELIANRWSPSVWADRPVGAADLRAVFEAARWAASAFNEQPWRYLVATRGEAPAAAAGGVRVRGRVRAAVRGLSCLKPRRFRADDRRAGKDSRPLAPSHP